MPFYYNTEYHTNLTYSVSVSFFPFLFSLRAYILNLFLDISIYAEYITPMKNKIIDQKSLKILKILQEKARIPNTEVARQVELAPSAVLERIRKMESQGIIDGYEVRLNPEQFSRDQVAFIIVKFDSRNISKAGPLLSSIEEIQEVHFAAGDDGYLVKVRVSDSKELNHILHKKILVLQGVTATKTLPVLATYKETARIPIR